MNGITYVGRLESVRLWDGTRVPVKGAVGILEGIGLVTATTKDELLRGHIALDSKLPYRTASEVYYYRDRAGYPSRYWVHELESSAVAAQAGGLPVFAHYNGGAARICGHLAGDFICAG